MARHAKHVGKPATVTERMPQKPDPIQQTHMSGVGPVLQPQSARVQRRLSGPADILSLQKTIGNRAVMRLLDKQRPVVQAKGMENPREERVQLQTEGQREPSNAEIHSAAARGVSTPTTTLPFLGPIQASFGRHSIGHIKAHVGSEAARASRDMGARAYASGEHVVFGGTPDLHTAAHEAAHVVQQRAGVQLAGGVGREDDRYENHADKVAAVVVAGRSAEGLLAPFAGSPPLKQPRTFAGTPSKESSQIHMSPAAYKPICQLLRLERSYNYVEEVKSGDSEYVYYTNGRGEDGKGASEVFWRVKNIVAPDRVGLLTLIAKLAGDVGEKIRQSAEGKWNEKPGKDPLKYNPIRVRFLGVHPETGDQKQLVIDYHFGDLWNGYVIGVKDTGYPNMTARQEMKYVKKKNTPVGPNQYSNFHDSTGGTQLTSLDSADAITKIAGEGARWRCIGENVGRLSDKTRIYSNEAATHTPSKPTQEVYFVEFSILWKSWVDTFKGEFRIDNKKVIEKLQTKTLVIRTDTSENYNVPKETCAAMLYDRDICVDSTKPANKEDLSVKRMLLILVKTTELVALSKATLSEQIEMTFLALKNMDLGVRPNGAYLGNNQFAFYSSVSKSADFIKSAGPYTISIEEEIFSYPAYREKAVPVLKEIVERQGEKNYEDERNMELQMAIDHLSAEMVKLDPSLHGELQNVRQFLSEEVGHKGPAVRGNDAKILVDVYKKWRNKEILPIEKSGE